ncbi:MAG: Sapep family Mn(2+)-dependent dipeptidase [Oscillospiraceae bacterium]|nr:Sapep family Mn(2+)-dependent dipeptidase [Oscillospiraceae bacterium]
MTDITLKSRIEQYFKDYESAIIEDVSTLVAIPSVRSEPLEGKPFGYYSYHALETALKMAEGYGFGIKNYDGYVGSIDFNDKETELGIFAHLDVVAVGDGWHSNPFEVKIEDGKLFGRGVSDDKGPAIAALYALKAVKDLGIELKKNVRLVLGTDEECGSDDLKHYFETEEKPKHSFTPDANFPVTNGEKGRFTKKFFSGYIDKKEGKRVVSIKGGEAANAVPGTCEAVVAGFDRDEVEWKALLASIRTDTDFTAEECENGIKIVCTGTSAHASLPQNGVNPITAMLTMLSSLSLDKSESSSRVTSLKELFPHGDYLGKAFGVDMSDKLGELTMTLDILNFENGRVEGCFDTRTPMCAGEENCAMPIASRLRSYGFVIENTDMRAPHYVDENSDFVKTLLKNYECFTGDKGECLCMGGGTYVHDIDGGVAFGAIRKGLETNMHGADEFMYIEDILTAAKIFTAVIIDVCG